MLDWNTVSIIRIQY